MWPGGKVYYKIDEMDPLLRKLILIASAKKIWTDLKMGCEFLKAYEGCPHYVTFKQKNNKDPESLVGYHINAGKHQFINYLQFISLPYPIYPNPSQKVANSPCTERQKLENFMLSVCMSCFLS